MTHLKGKVVAFDDATGLGKVQAGDGSSYRFHCTQILDGSRTIAVGTPVAFTVAPGRRGEWEAAEVEDLLPAQASGRVPGEGG